jgi:hypothetical protein
MRKTWTVGYLFLLAAGLANAQVPTSGNVFVGYSYFNTPEYGSTSRASLNGGEASIEGKVFPFVGIVADFGGYNGSGSAPAICPGSCVVTGVGTHEYSFLFGPRISISVGKVRPFAEALFGAGRFSSAASSQNSFANAVGGGIDYKVIRPLALRFEGDFVQTRFFSTTQNSARVSTGIVLRF